MQTAKLLNTGQSQAVSLPDGLNFAGSEVYAKKIGHTIMLFPKDKVWETFLEGLNGFTEDFMAEPRTQGEQQAREVMDV